MEQYLLYICSFLAGAAYGCILYEFLYGKFCRHPIKNRSLCKNSRLFRLLPASLTAGFTITLASLCYETMVQLLLLTTISVLLAVTAQIDRESLTIPNQLTLIFFVLSCISVWFFKEISLFDRLAGAMAVSLPMFLLTLAIPGSFGGGDIKLIAAAGVFLGMKNTILAGFLGILFGGIAAIVLLCAGKIGQKEHMAFGPYLAAGIWVAMMFGENLILWYFKLFDLTGCFS